MNWKYKYPNSKTTEAHPMLEKFEDTFHTEARSIRNFISHGVVARFIGSWVIIGFIRNWVITCPSTVAGGAAWYFRTTT
jgi:hypothetical protein